MQLTIYGDVTKHGIRNLGAVKELVLHGHDGCHKFSKRLSATRRVNLGVRYQDNPNETSVAFSKNTLSGLVVHVALST